MCVDDFAAQDIPKWRPSALRMAIGGEGTIAFLEVSTGFITYCSSVDELLLLIALDLPCDIVLQPPVR